MSKSVVLHLRADNFKRLRAVDVRPNGSVVEIAGRNGQGKSSVLDAIMAAISAWRLARPDSPWPAISMRDWSTDA